MSNEKTAAFIAAILLSIVSASADWGAYQQISSGVVGVVLGGMIVAAIVIVKGLLSARLSAAGGYQRVSILLMLAPLVLLSVFTGVLFFKARLDAASSLTVRDSYQYQSLTRSVEALERQQIALEQQLAACPAGWRSKCIDPLKSDIDELAKQKTQITITMATLPSASGSSGFWSGAAAGLGWSVDRLHWTVFGGLSLLIDCLSIVCFSVWGGSVSALFSQGKNSFGNSCQPFEKTDNSLQNKPETVVEKERVATPKNPDADLEAAILSGEIRPSTSQLIKRGVAYKRAASILDGLWSRGLLDREMKGKSKYYSLKKRQPALRVV